MDWPGDAQMKLGLLMFSAMVVTLFGAMALIYLDEFPGWSLKAAAGTLSFTVPTLFWLLFAEALNDGE